MSKTNTNPVVLVDVSNLAYRSHYAYKGLSYQGQPTSVYYGFLRAVLNLREQYGDRLVFCWDYGLPGQKTRTPWRKKLFPQYKAGREETEDRKQVCEQFPELYRVLGLLGWKSFGVPGLEADDIMGLFVGANTTPFLLFTTDQDLYQLLRQENVRVLRPDRNGSTAYRTVTAEQVVAEYDISLDVWPSFLALGGDTSDGIHVVAGLGPKTGIKMLQAGGYLSEPWEDLPLGFRRRFGKYEKHWETLQAAYQVASIPTSCVDPRLGGYLDRTVWHDVTDYIRAPVAEKQCTQFMGFCADYGLMEFLAGSKQFFQ